MQGIDRLSRAYRRRLTARKLNTTTVVAPSSEVPASTRWHRSHGRPSRAQKAVSQQYLTPEEEIELREYLLRCHRNGHPIKVKALPYLALVIARHRSSTLQTPAADQPLRAPSKNWPQGFYLRHPEVKSKRLKALDARRYGPNIYEKVVHWFTVMGPELRHPAIRAENVYNMDETGVQLSVLGTQKVLVSREDVSGCRGTGVKRDLITAVECIAADGRSLAPLIVWPSVTHRSSWITHPTPDWHFAVSKSGYVDSEISLYWLQKVFDPQTRARANGRPRILINDGFTTHESLEILEFCFENNIVLCRLPSHTSHKLQPCDVSVFGPLKTAYREQVEKLYQGGANTVRKEHFTLLYGRARHAAFTPRNIRAGFAKTGLVPFNPDTVLRHIERPRSDPGLQIRVQPGLESPVKLTTPVTSEGLITLCTKIEKQSHDLDGSIASPVQKLVRAAKRAMAGRDLLHAENDTLRQQNNEKKTRQSAKAQTVGTAKVMSYQDLVEAMRVREVKDADREARRRTTTKASGRALPPVADKRMRLNEAEAADREIVSMGLQDFCSTFSVLNAP